MVSIYLDDCLVDHHLVRPLRGAGHLIYVPEELGLAGQPDEMHLASAASLGAVMVSQNKKDFEPLYARWLEQGRTHAGIITVTAEWSLGRKIACLERAARLLTPAAAANQLMVLSLFGTEEEARTYVASLTPTFP